MAFRVEVIGLDELLIKLKELLAGDDNLNASLKEAHMEVATEVARAAVRLAPVETGRLAMSIKPKAQPKGGGVQLGSSSVPYAGPIVWGWEAHNIEPNPFPFEAIDEVDVIAAYEKGVNEMLKKEGLAP